MSKRHLKYLDRYTCEYDFIPNILTSLYLKRKIDDNFMTHPIEWKKILPKYGFGYDFGLRNIVVEKSEEKSKRAKFKITFPKPEVPPQCFYAILFIGKGGYNYYTLELDLGSKVVLKNGGGIVCGQKGSNHLNYGRRCKEDWNEFEQAVQDIMHGKSFDLVENYNDLDFNAAAKELGMKDENELKEECIIY